MTISSTQDVTAKIIDKTVTPIPHATKGRVQVVCQVTIDPGTADTYTTGGISLHMLFTAGTSSDVGIDPTRPVYGMASIFSPTGTAQAKGLLVNFADTAATALGKKLVVYNFEADNVTLSQGTLLETVNTDLTAGAYLNTDGDWVGLLELWGFER